MADGAEKRLAKMRQAMAKLRREGREKEFTAVAEAYAALKREQMERAEEELREQARVRAAARRAERVREGPERWRLPRGFGVSPLAAQRAREGRPEVPVVPVGRPALSPWRRSHPASEVVWEPGRRR
jgi:hypothetical protein